MSMNRVASACLVLAGVIVTCGVSVAQQTTKIPRIGIMINGGPGPVVEALKRDFAKAGYVEGQTIAFEPRYAEGQLGRHPELAADLARLDVDAILTLGGPASRAAKDATSKIPIVFSIVTDPVALGLVVSMEKPGGNATGLTNLDPQQAAKQMELLKETFPDLKRIAILSDQDIPGADASGLAPIERSNVAAARALGLEPQVIKLKGPTPDIDGAFAAMKSESAQAVLVLEVPVTLVRGKLIAERATAQRLPTMFPGGQKSAEGVIAYGTTVADTWPRMPIIADRILKGAKPGDIPVEVISRRQLIINLKTAAEAGVSIPAGVLARADEVIR
jgi:putative ABC transport system substrate-binding protein